MSTWILQHFLNPALFWPGMALLAAPIIIHLINRMRYRRVRFAAMEFLLASQKQNRRRLLIEELLLLLLRMLLILLIVALIARLVTDPDQLSLFQGARTEHVVILDDSASMRDREGEGNVFDIAKDAVRRIVAEGARRPGSQSLTLVLMSDPDHTVSGLSERVIDEPLLTEITDRLESLECTHQYSDPAAALEAAQRRLLEHPSTRRQVHVLSDFRKSNWIDNKAAISILKELDQAEIGVNLVRCVAGSHENLGVVELGGAVEVAAAGVPVSLSATVQNFGTRQAENVRLSLFVDDSRLPRTIDFQSIPPGQTATRRFDVVFETAQPHRVRVSLADDALEADNNRYLAVDVPQDNPVLIVDGSPGAEQAAYVADALAADRSVTGFAPDIRSPEDLRRVSLDDYHLIYLINVGELAPDAIAALEDYVREGGGLIWYLGDAVRPAFYNEKLFAEEGRLFPVRLDLAPMEYVRPLDSLVGTGIQVGDDPLFSLFTQSEVPILDQVLINLLYPLAPDSPNQPHMADDVQVLAHLGNEPLMLEHQFGKGKIFTCLTSAGPLINPQGINWSNWANGPAGFSFVVLQLELAKRLLRKDLAFPELPTGTPLKFEFLQTQYLPEIEILTPDDRVESLQATHAANEKTSNGSPDPLWHATFRETDEPGVYAATFINQEQTPTHRLFALNVPAVEGALQVADDETLLRELGTESSVRIQSAGNFDWIRSESPGSEIRWFLLICLAVVCMAEQWLSAKLSFQPGS